MASDPRFATGADRVLNRGETVAIVSGIMLTKPRNEWLELLNAHSIPGSPVHTLGELSDHPHPAASDMFLHYRTDKGRNLNAVASPLRIDGERPKLRQKPPSLGQDSLTVLAEFGYSPPEIEAFISKGVVVGQ